MCFQISTITTNTHKSHTVRWRQHNPNNVCTVPMCSTALLSIPIDIQNCQSAVNKAEFLSSTATPLMQLMQIINLNLTALAETWIKPEVQGSLLFVTYTIIQGIISSEM